MSVDDLRGLHEGETCWIVGKGPSLRYLTPGHFMDDGPVITINQALEIVQAFGISNPLYSLQKDARDGELVQPLSCVTVILQAGRSEHRFAQHERRVVVDIEAEMGFAPDEMSIRMAVFIARVMDCERINFVCCDSLTGHDDYRRLDVESGKVVQAYAGAYRRVKPLVLADVAGMAHGFVVPRRPRTEDRGRKTDDSV